MWILPRPTSVAFSALWVVVEENEYFSLLENKTSSKAIIGTVASLFRRVGNAARDGLAGAAVSEPLRYRIVLRDDEHHALALADEWDEIERDWEWIKVMLLPRLVGLEMGHADKLRYILDKFTARCNEVGEEELKRQSDSRHYQKKFGLAQEELVATYFCSLWQEGFVGTHRTGTMWVSANYICFDSRLMRQKFVIAFRDVVKITKGTSHFGVLDSSLSIHTKQGEEYFFSTLFNREEVMTLLEHLWSSALDRLLSSSSSATAFSSPQAQPAPDIFVPFVFPPDTPSSSASSSTTPAAIATTTTTSTATATTTTSSGSSSPAASTGASPSPGGGGGAQQPMGRSGDLLQLLLDNPDPGKSPGSPPLFSPPFARRSLASKGELTRRRNAQGILSLFRFPAHEAPIEEHGCSLLWDGTYLKGQCYVSRSFLYFRSTKGSEVRLTLPWASIDGIAKDNPYKSAISVIAHDKLWERLALPSTPRQYVFSFVGTPRAAEVMGGIVTRWKTLMGLPIGTASSSSSSSTPPPVTSVTTASSLLAGLSSELAPTEDTRQREGVEAHEEREAEHTDDEPEVLRGQGQLKRSLHALADRHHQESELEEQWRAYFELYGSGACMMITPELKHLVRLGIPNSMRAQLWRLCSGSVYYQLAEPHLYERLLADNAGVESNATEEIERDLHRSLPEHPFFRRAEGIEALRRVLTAYSWHNPHIGYCQGMNIVAAQLLLHMEEEDAFYLLATIAEQIVPQYYHTEMVGSLVDQQILEELTKIYMPEVVEHLERVRIPLSLVSLPWLLCLFIGALPESASLRVLGALFFEGPNVLFQVSLAILKIMEEAILATDLGDVAVPLIKDFVAHPDETLLFQVAYREFNDLPAAKINEMRSTNRYHVIMNMEHAAKKSFLRTLKMRTLFTEEELEGMYGLFQNSICASSEGGLAVDQTGFEHVFEKVLYWWQRRTDLMELSFKLLDKEGKGFLSFTQFVGGISPLCKGTLPQQFRFCFDMHDLRREGQINVGSLYNALDALLRIYEPPPEGEDEADRGPTVSVELDKFVLLVFEHIGGPEGGFEQVTFERLQPVLFDTPLLLQFLSARIGEQRALDVHHWHPRLQTPKPHTSSKKGGAVHDM